MQGPILAFIYAVKEMLEEGQGTDGSLPVNVAFVFEGEEENGKQALQHRLAEIRNSCDCQLPSRPGMSHGQQLCRVSLHGKLHRAARDMNLAELTGL